MNTSFKTLKIKRKGSMIWRVYFEGERWFPMKEKKIVNQKRRLGWEREI
jgi:hypothetical protein